MKLSREEKQEMINECLHELKMLKINNSYPRQNNMWARFLVLVMEAEIHD